jgi:hypothetical protein
MEMISCKKLYDETGMDTYISLSQELEFFKAFLRLRGLSQEAIARAKDDYEKILKRLSITLHEEPNE